MSVTPCSVSSRHARLISHLPPALPGPRCAARLWGVQHMAQALKHSAKPYHLKLFFSNRNTHAQVCS